MGQCRTDLDASFILAEKLGVVQGSRDLRRNGGALVEEQGGYWVGGACEITVAAKKRKG